MGLDDTKVTSEENIDQLSNSSLNLILVWRAGAIANGCSEQTSLGRARQPQYYDNCARTSSPTRNNPFYYSEG